MIARTPSTRNRYPTVAVAGTGYVGARLAARLAERGCRVLAGRREPPSPGSLPQGVIPFALDLDAGTGLAPLAAADVVVCAVPPAGSPDRDLRSERLAAALARHSPRQLIYLSTTGGYGDRSGAEIGETDPPAPRTERARRRLAAEACWRRFGAEGRARVQIIRVAGIYGPGRLPTERVRSGEALRVAWPETRYTNTIHVDDLVSLILRTMVRGRPNRVYNACDGAERRQGALLETVAAELGVALAPPLTPEAAYRELSPMRLSFLEESRRCRADRAMAELGWRPRYTDLSEGVRASLAAES